MLKGRADRRLLSLRVAEAVAASLFHPRRRRVHRHFVRAFRQMKIGLLAMSGVRCRNEELLALGLTLPGFVERSKVVASLPSLGLLTLAGMSR